MTQHIGSRATNLLTLLLIPLIGNAIYLTAFHDMYPDCGNWCILFFNISFLTLFLPALWNWKHGGRYLKSGQQLIATFYLSMECVLAIWLLSENQSSKTALLWQMALLGVFLLIFFWIAKKNTHTEESLILDRSRRSKALTSSLGALRASISEHKSEIAKTILQSAIADISGSPVYSMPETEEIESKILRISLKLSENPEPDTYSELNMLLSKRRALIISLS